MTTARRAVLIAYLLAITLLCLWVPWRARYEGYTTNAGYSLLWRPPKVLKPKSEVPEAAVYKSVDGLRLALQLAACTGLFAVAFLLLPRPTISKRYAGLNQT